MEAELKTYRMNEEKVNVIIVTFADYVENYYEEDNTSGDVSTIVNDHFDEFIEWAYDDFVINEEEQEIMEGNPDPEIPNCIKKEVIQEFLMILRLRTYAAKSSTTASMK